MRALLSWLLLILLSLVGCNSETGSQGEDLFGIKSDPNVNVNLLSVTPSNKFLLANQTFAFGASGGLPPYTFTLDSGVGTVSPTGEYTSPAFTGVAVIAVTDTQGKQAFGTITIGSLLSLSPKSVTLGQSTVQAFSTTGGVSPYTYSIVSGSGSINSSSGSFTSAATPGTTIVKVEDTAGNTDLATVIVNTTLSISPSSITLGFNESTTFTGSGGQLPYSFNVLVGTGTITSSGGVFTSSATAESSLVRLTDNAGNSVDANVTIVNKPQISPENSQVGTNEDMSFSASGGTASYTYSIVSGGGTINTSTGSYTAPSVVGTAVIRVTDNNGYTDDTNLTIFKPTQVALGEAHTCVTKFSNDTTGTTKCFGATSLSLTETGLLGSAASNNIIGDSSSEMGDALSTVSFSSTLTVKSISIARNHGCVVLSNDTVKCWGVNNNGALHNGSNNTDHKGYTPGQMGNSLALVNLGTGRTVNNVLAADKVIDSFLSNTCVILDNDELRCWGRNNNGQLGLGNTGHRGDAIGEVGDGTPNVNLGGVAPIGIATSQDFACALLTGGSVKCWGEAQYGSLGYGNTTDKGKTGATTPDTYGTVDLNGSVITKIDAGYYFTCALSTVGDVKCWGYNAYGQLGAGSTTNLGSGAGEMGANLNPVNLGTGMSATDIATGYEHACAVRNDGSVVCWGRGNRGQLGNGTNVNIGTQVAEMGDNLVPVDLGSGRTATAIWATMYSTCAKLDNSTTKCWGENSNGQLGAGHVFDVGLSPVSLGDNLSALNLGTGRTVTKIETGDYGSCALLDNGTVKCWGQDFFGTRGDENFLVGDSSTDMGANLPTNSIGTGLSFKKIKSYRRFTCGLTFGGVLKCWGVGSQGALGQGNQNSLGFLSTEVGNNLPTLNFGTGRTVKDFDVGYRGGCAILDNDNLKCWGRGNSGKNGQGNTAARGDGSNEMGDNLAVVDLGAGLYATQVSVSNDFVCSVLNNGLVKCWGLNNRGQLGIGNTSVIGNGAGEMGAALQYASLGTGLTAKSVCTGDEFSCAHLSDNTLKCWGHQNYVAQASTNGHIGDAANEMGDFLPAINLGTGLSVKKMDCGRAHTCVILSDGSLKCFGSGGNGRLGLGNGTATIGDGAGEMGDQLTTVNLGSGRKAISIYAGSAHTCAVLDNNTVKCWGYNAYGQLGQGHITDLGATSINMGDSLLPISTE